MTQIPAGWYDDPNGGQRRYWNGTAWADQVVPPRDQGKWEQAPDGTWHRRSWWSMHWGAVLAVVIAGAVGGYGLWSWWDDQQRQDQMERDMTCAIVENC